MKHARCILLALLAFSTFSYAQNILPIVSGVVVDEQHHGLQNVSIVILGRQTGTITNDSGRFAIRCPPNKPFALVFSYSGYLNHQINFNLKSGEHRHVTVQLRLNTNELDEVTVTDDRARSQPGLITIDPNNALNIPAPGGGIESLVKIFTGSNNELSSQYSVRGGNYDENLVYVNDFEVFKPYLVRNGQQEGLSFINPEMVKSINFYNGGFQARYGDKMSSVLDIQYKTPKSSGGTAYAGLIEQGLHVEGSTQNQRFTYLAAVRNRNNRNLLRSQPTKGNYVPSSRDAQGLFSYKVTNTSSLELLVNFSQTQFKLQPQFSQVTTSVFSPFLSANLGLDVYFDGQEDDRYHTTMAGLSFSHQIKQQLRMKWMVSRFGNVENEGIDITGAYLFGEREFDPAKADFGMITNPLGAGVHQTYARNRLDISVWNASHRGYLDLGKHFIQWGQSVDLQRVSDKLHEWEYVDSAGYSLPYSSNDLQIWSTVRSSANLDIVRVSGFIQDNYIPPFARGVSLQAGVRYNYNDLNDEILVSPRAAVSWKPLNWKRDVVFRAAAGAYHQPPFYRELRSYNGKVNEDLKAQRSWQVSGGLDYSFSHRNRPFRFASEIFFKGMSRIVPYDIDNVRIRYSGRNEAKAYAAGVEARLFAELVKDAESWISLSFMRARENLDNDTYYRYEVDSLNQVTDSSAHEGGWFRRPTDRLFTFGLFLQDYLATNKNFRVFLNFLYGSNMPFNIPQSVRYRNAMIIDPYLRVDIGFSTLLLDGIKHKAPVKSVWASLEVFNLLDRANTISYMLIKDFSNTRFALPNRLTPRLLNLKVITRF